MKSALAVVLPLYVVIATAIGFVDFRTRAHVARGYEAYPQAVVANLEEPPGKYRVLAPYLFEGAVALTGADRQVAWVVFRWLTILAALWATHSLLRVWFSEAEAVAGAVVSSVLLLLTFTNSWPHPDHLVEWALASAAVWAIARGRDGWLLPILVAAAFNRETSAFLVLLYACARPWSVGHVARSAAFGAVWAAIYTGLRWWRGVAWYDPWQASRNLDFLGLLPDSYDPYFRVYAWFGIILLLPVAWLGWRSWAVQPRVSRAGLGIVVPAFAVTAFLFSSIVETRIFTPLIPMLVVVVMFAVARADNSTQANP